MFDPDPLRRRFEALDLALRPPRNLLEMHPVYRNVRDTEALRIFMRAHVFAVWDFMSLAKALQRALTCIEVPWLPPADPVTARFINEIVLAEETDEVAPGYAISHFELYRQAMQEEDADLRPIDTFIAALRGGRPLDSAISAIPLGPHVRDFVSHTMALSQRPVHEVAAAFLFGREAVIPDMFTRVLRGRGEAVKADRGGPSRGRRVLDALRGPPPRPSPERARPPRRAFVTYLERHIELDGDQHGPMGARMLRLLCGEHDDRWRAAEQVARRAIATRHALWDGVLAEIEADAQG